MPGIIDRRAARHRAPGRTVRTDDDVLRDAPGYRHADAAYAARGAGAVVHGAAGHCGGSERGGGGAIVCPPGSPAQILESHFQLPSPFCPATTSVQAGISLNRPRRSVLVAMA